MSGSRTKNLLLNCMAEEDWSYLSARLERVPLDEGYVIVGQGETIHTSASPSAA